MKKTRQAVCDACYLEFGYNNPPSEEKVARVLLAQMLGHHFEVGKHFGGAACAKDVPESENGKAKYAFCDITFWDGIEKVAYVEIDEGNGHTTYPETCELTRYDTLFYGCTETKRKHSRCFRLNTTVSEEDQTSLEDRVRILAENIRQFFDDSHLVQMLCLTVSFLHYPALNVHMANANNATGALAVVAPYVTSIDAVRADFKNVSLKDIPRDTLKAICVEDIEKIR